MAGSPFDMASSTTSPSVFVTDEKTSTSALA